MEIFENGTNLILGGGVMRGGVIDMSGYGLREKKERKLKILGVGDEGGVWYGVGFVEGVKGMYIQKTARKLVRKYRRYCYNKKKFSCFKISGEILKFY